MTFGDRAANEFFHLHKLVLDIAIVNAPVITEYPLTLECEVIEIQQQPYGLRVLGGIINVIADEKILDEKGKIDAGKIQAFAFDQMKNGYYAIGEKVGQAWHSGAEYLKK